MVTEASPKLRGPITGQFEYTNTSTSSTIGKGTLRLIGAVWGAFLQNVGTATGSKDRDNLNLYPNGEKGVFVYAASKIILTKAKGAGESFATGALVYVSTTDSTKVATGTSGTKIGVALEYASTSDSEVMIEMRPF